MLSLYLVEEKKSQKFRDDIVEITLDWTVQVETVWRELLQPLACPVLSSCPEP